MFVTQRLSRLLDAAEREAKRFKDEYVSVEHLLLALVEEGSATAAGRLLKEYGATRDAVLGVLTRIRGNQRVTSAMPESAYEAWRNTGGTSSPTRGTGGWTRSPGVTPRSGGSFRSCPASRRTIPC